MVIVTWTSGADAGWCSLDAVKPAALRTVGVYMIWYAGTPGRVVAVGQGDVGDRLAAAQRDAAIQTFKERGELLVTWAKVSAMRIDGIERFLAETWTPLIARERPGVAPIEVNSPGWMRAFV
jgi:hypothetical protein